MIDQLPEPEGIPIVGRNGKASPPSSYMKGLATREEVVIATKNMAQRVADHLSAEHAKALQTLEDEVVRRLSERTVWGRTKALAKKVADWRIHL